MVAGERAVANLVELHGRVGRCFSRPEPCAQAGKYITALMGDLPSKNGWTIAEHAGDSTPDRTQRLLNHAVWDARAAEAVVRGFAAEHLDGESLVVGALDESGQQKQGEATAGATRQYMGCAGRVANGVNTVYCGYATTRGHALVGARIWVPAAQLDDAERRDELAIPTDVTFKTKPQLAHDIVADMVADHTMPPWFAGDEVYAPLVRATGLPRDSGGRVCDARRMRLPDAGDTGSDRTRGRPAHQALDGGRSTASGRRFTRLPGRKAPAPTHGPGSRPQPIGTTCSSAATWPAVSWPTTTATSRPGARSP
jgi:DDE superfamily endonuclease